MLMKTCSKCKVEKPEEMFGKDKSRKDGLGHRCRDCCKAINAARYQAHPERHKENTSAWYQANSEHVKNKGLQRLYGITLEQYDTLLESQQGLCKLCRTNKPGKGKYLHVDHDHVTGKVRGLLCNNCNRGLGLLKDDPFLLLAAIEYLGSHASA